MNRGAAVALALAAMVAATSCRDRPQAASGPQIGASATGGGQVTETAVPATIAGLTTRAEDIDALEEEAGPDSYVTDTRLWSLRSGERPRATLQVSRFAPDADPGDEELQRRIVAQIGQAGAVDITVGGHTVYVTASNQQGVYSWFTGPYLFVLSIAREHHAPRELLRAAVETRP